MKKIILFKIVKTAAIASFIIFIYSFQYLLAFDKKNQKNDKLLDESGWVDYGEYKQQISVIDDLLYLKFSKDGKKFFTFDYRGKFSVWDSKTGKDLKDFYTGFTNIPGFDFNLEDEKTIAITSYNYDSVYVYDISTDSLKYFFDDMCKGNDLPPDSYVYRGCNILMNPFENIIKTCFHYVDYYQFSYPISMSCSWSIVNGDNISSDEELGNGDYAISNDYRYMVTNNTIIGFNDATYNNCQTILYDIKNHKKDTLLEYSGDYIDSMLYKYFAFSNDSKYLATWSHNKISIFRTDNGSLVNTFSSREPTCMAYTMDDKLLMIGYYDNGYYSQDPINLIYFKNPKDGKNYDSIAYNNYYGRKFVLSPDSSSVIVNSYGSLRLYPILKIPEILSQFDEEFTLRHTNDPIHFTDVSLGNPTSWVWDFGDGTISNEQNPVHTYTKTGLYTVSLVISNGTLSDSFIKPDLIRVKLPLKIEINVGPKTGSSPLTVTFKDKSIGEPTKWTWDFGDGHSSTEQNPTNTYIYDGSYSVKLLIEDDYYYETVTVDSLVNVIRLPITEAEVSFEKDLRLQDSCEADVYNGLLCEGNGFIIAGADFGNNPSNFIIRLNNNCDIIWTTKVDVDKVSRYQDGSFLIIKNPNGYDFIKFSAIDDQGLNLWNSQYNSQYYDFAYDIHATNDNCMLINGKSFNDTVNSQFLLKIDNKSNIKWRNEVSNPNQFYVTPTNDDGCVYSVLNASNNKLIDITKLDVNNQITWSNTLYNNYPFFQSDIKQTSDSGYMLTGSTVIDSHNYGFIIKTNSLGELQWNYTSNNKGVNFKNIDRINNSVYVVSIDSSGCPGYLIMDMASNIRQQVIFKNRTFRFVSISATQDNCLFFTGNYRNNDGDYIYCLKTKIDPQYLSVPEQPLNSGSISFRAYPNPFSESITIEYSLPEPSSVKVSLYDIFGNEVDVIERNEYQQGVQRVEYSGSKLSQGMYFLRVMAGTMTATERVVFVK